MKTIRTALLTATAVASLGFLYTAASANAENLDEVMARRAEGRFIHHHATSLAAGYLPGGAVWVHLRLARDPQTPGDWWLEAAEDLIDDITLYEIAPDGQISVRQGGRALPFAQRELAWHKHAFRLTLEDTAPRDLYLRYASTATLRITPRLFQPGAYDQHRAMEDLIAGAYFGIMTFTLLISGLRAFRYRSLLDGCYALYLFGLDGSNFVNFGWLQQFGLTDSLPLRQFLVGGGYVLSAVAITGFLRLLIDWPTVEAKRHDRYLRAILLLYVASYLLIWFTVPSLALAFVNGVSALFIFGLVGAALWGTYHGFANARFFMIAFTPFFLIALTRLADSFGLIRGGDAIYYLFLLASTIHAGLLLVAILMREAGLRRAKDQLEWQVARMQEDMANHALFMRLLAHEVRTPLAIIDSYSQLLGRGAWAGPLPAGAGARVELAKETAVPRPVSNMQHHIVHIRGGMRRLSAILDRFLQQDRLTHPQPLDQVTLDLRQLIASTVAEVQQQTENHLLSFQCESEALTLEGDPSLLQVMLLNLLENAVRYSPEGGAIQVVARAEDGIVTLAVSDEGVGIAPEAQERIFERYFRTSQVKDAIGAGLGLYIVRGIARLHGGDVTCESTLGEGSTFRVSLRRTEVG